MIACKLRMIEELNQIQNKKHKHHHRIFASHDMNWVNIFIFAKHLTFSHSFKKYYYIVIFISFENTVSVIVSVWQCTILTGVMHYDTQHFGEDIESEESNSEGWLKKQNIQPNFIASLSFWL